MVVAYAGAFRCTFPGAAAAGTAVAAAAAAASPSEPRGGGGDTVVVDVVVALVRVRCAPYSSGFPFVGVWREGARGGAG